MKIRLRKKKSEPRQPLFGKSGKPSTFSYHANRSDSPNQPRKWQKKHNFSASLYWLKRLPTFLTALAILVSFLYAQSLEPKPRLIIDAPQQSQTNRLSPDAYQKVAEKALKGSILNRSKITISSSNVTKQLLKTFPEITEANMELSILGRRPVIRIKVATAAILLISRSGTYIVDEAGKAIASADNLGALNQLSLVTVTDESGLEVSSGSQALTSEEVQFMQVVSQQLKAQKIIVQSMTLPPIANELRVRLTGQPYYVKFNLSEDPRLAAGSLLATKAKLEADHITPSEYIDVRLEERAYYK